MRLRNVKGSREAVAQSPYVVSEPEKYKGRYGELFKNDNPIYIEIGMGKGRFITSLALANPNVNYIGIEKYSAVLIRALEKREEIETDINNLLFIRADAENITDIFGAGEIAGIYLNFSDPWPKARHAGRRLTSRQFFARYDIILREGGMIEFKTDNRMLFDFSLEEIPAAGFKVLNCSYDLHNDPQMCEGNVMTEYEEKFSSIGNPIHKFTCIRC